MRRGRWGSIVLLSIFFLLPSNLSMGEEIERTAVEREVEVVRILPHDPTSFTQGLEVLNDSLIESSGLYGASRLSQISSKNGDLIRQTPIEESYFAEGITIMGNSIIMLTWKSGIALEFELTNFTEIGNFSLEGEGWGICFNGQHLVTSNGSSELSFRNPKSFKIDYTIEVTWDEEPVLNLNELECVGNKIFANVWMQDIILSISATSGKVDFFASPVSITSQQGNGPNEVLNGIAYDSALDGFWITGKNWTNYYLIDFVMKEEIQLSEGIFENHQTKISSAVFFTSLLLILYYFRKKKDPETPNFKDSHH